MSQQPEQTAEFQLRINEITNLIAGHKGVISREVHWSECIPALAGYVCKQTASLQKQRDEAVTNLENCESLKTFIEQKEQIKSLQKQLEELRELLKESISAINYVQMAEGYENQNLIKSADKAWTKVHDFKNKAKKALQSPPGESEKENNNQQ